MNLKDAVKLALIYRQISPEFFKAYTELVDRTADSFNIEDAKSIRFEKDHKKFTSVCNKNSTVITTPNPLDPDEAVSVVCYSVIMKGKDGAPDTVEKGHRYMFYSDKFTDAFSVRVFQEEKQFNMFKHYNRITVVDEFDFKGARFILYKSKDSNVERVAIFCSAECDLTPEDFASHVSYKTLDSTNKTKVFG